MTKSLRGGNSPLRVKEQRRQAFSASRAELEAMTKPELIALAGQLEVLPEVPNSSKTGTPLKSDLVCFLTDLSGQFRT